MYSCSLFEQFSNPICVSWSRPEVVYDRPCLHFRTNLVHLRTNLGPRIAFWGPDLGPCFGFHFWAPVWALELQTKSRARKQGPKYPNQNAIRSPKFVRRCKQGLHDLHSAVCLAILFNYATNQQLQPKKEGKLGRAKLLKQRAWIHSQTKHSQDMFYLQKIDSQVSRMGKSTACLLR